MGFTSWLDLNGNASGLYFLLLPGDGFADEDLAESGFLTGGLGSDFSLASDFLSGVADAESFLAASL